MALPTLHPAFQDIAGRVNNWGRWGTDDEIGTLNLITDEVVRAAAAEVRTGRRVPLALPLREDGVQTGMIPGRVNPLHAMVQINQEIFGPGTVACSDDAVTMGLQAATHWDALTARLLVSALGPDALRGGVRGVRPRQSTVIMAVDRAHPVGSGRVRTGLRPLSGGGSS
ncbi:hypothetical protein SAURM35S_09696 [Streptomyces aurantiogriseus]